MTDHLNRARLTLAQNLADSFADLPGVEAVVLGGSVASGQAGPDSDIDLYVYVQQEIPVATRARLIHPRARRAEIDQSWAEPGDAWIEAATGIAVDVMYRRPAWIEEQLDRVLLRHEASVGYSTAFWHNVRHSVPLFDRNGWFRRLQARAAQPYPEALVQAIIARNHPILRSSIFSWLHQLENAVQRDDWVAANEKVEKLLASYFDVLFALNRRTHPGEKRLLKLAASCEKTPPRMAEQVVALVQALMDHQRLCQCADELLDGLDELLLAEGLIDGSTPT